MSGTNHAHFVPACEWCQFPIGYGEGALFARYADINNEDGSIEWHPEHYACTRDGGFKVPILHPLHYWWFIVTGQQLELFGWVHRSNWVELSERYALAAVRRRWGA